ncbi:hypothetical protein Br6_04793 [Rhodococcus sp. Br-6]|nr:hypothetical protein Br6_04793 [Rhodococcus sp. Br-6]
MSTVDVLAQIPDVKPEAPPFFPELVGTFDTLWWLVLVTAVLAFAVGLASERGVIQLRTTWEFPLLFGGPLVAGLMVWALVYGV